MQETFAGHGIAFDYPGYWEISEQQTDDGLTITVEPGDTAFWCITLYPQRPASEDVLRTALEIFQEEYSELDSSAVSGRIAGFVATGCDLEFGAMELINGAGVRAFRTPRFTVFVMYQGLDKELNDAREEFDRMTSSLRVDIERTLFD